MGLFDDKMPAQAPEPDVSLPPANSVVTNTTKDPLSDRPERKESSAKAWADSKGYFSTDLVEDVRKLTAAGHQPTHVEGAKADRPHKLFVYAMTPEAARALLETPNVK